MMGNDEKHLAQYKKTLLLNQNPSFVKINKGARRKATVAKFESKYLESGTDIIQEMSEEQEESKRAPSDAQGSEAGSQFENPFMKSGISFLGRDRAMTRTDEEWNNLINAVKMDDPRKNTLLSFNGSFGKESEQNHELNKEGELLLLEY